MPSSKKISAAFAYEIAGIHRDRFNEHVASGSFPCAPRTVAGRARQFELEDILALSLFQTLMNEGLPASTAGAISCAVSRAAKKQPWLRFVAYIYSSASSPNTIAMTRMSEMSTWESDPNFDRATVFDVGKLRRIIADQVARLPGH